ncbi:MAG: hypothetical protein Q4D12_06120 [Bacteroidales bacterium]|nr:hypothetical protein [Bacteroidales bacterium]
MSLDCESRIDLIHKYLDKSNQTWEEAEAAKKLGMWPMTANRMYYYSSTHLEDCFLQTSMMYTLMPA